MKQRYFFIFILLLVLSGCSPNPQPSPSKAVKGTLNLSGWNFEKEGTVPLKGEWAFYWKKLYTPGDFKKTTPKPVWVQVPKVWNDYQIDGHSLPGTGYATYRLHVLVNHPDKTLAVKIPYASTAYKMWINGKEVASNGVVGTSKATSKPQYLNQVATFKGNADIVIQVSNFQHRRGGIFQPLTIGTTEEIVRAMNIHVGRQLLIFGSLLIIGLYYIVLYGFRRRSIYYLIFGLLCICMAIHNQCEGEVPITQFFPHFNWEALLKLEYMTADIGKILLFPLFFYFLYPNLLHKKVIWAISALSALFFLTALSTPASFFTNYYLFGNMADMLTMLYLWWMLVKAVLEKREHARIILFGFTIFMLTVFNDILYDMRMIHTGYYLEWGLDFFILGLGLVLALNFSKSFVLTEKLSFQLTELNQSLEKKVKSRTKKMEESNRNLRETNEQLK
ncbi:MAG TPA: 7TM-DISM domain-containing protein, partial [Bacillales bacterium]|nr:7TM-DISM domain-containing protein [Bacillales bacterium]